MSMGCWWQAEGVTIDQPPLEEPDQPPVEEPEGGPVPLVEALSREDGKNSTVRVYPDRIEWIKQMSISSVPRSRSDPPVIPIDAVAGVKAKKDGPLFTKVLLRTSLGTVTFRMHHPQALQVRDAIEAARAGRSRPGA